MQSYFKLPWCSDQIAPKMQISGGVCTSPVVDTCVPMLNKLKRKRTESPEAGSLPLSDGSIKKQRSDGDALPQLPPSTTRPAAAHVESQSKLDTAQTPRAAPSDASAQQSNVSNAVSSVPQGRADSFTDYERGMATKSEASSETKLSPPQAQDNVATESTKAAADNAQGMSPLQQVIENEFNMQILMKHNELRLIEQELGKCQVALEQLRRCELRPYPGSEGPTASISAGTGSAVVPPSGFTRPSHASPYGVTDGPYSRHYRQWLLPDAQFDPVPEHLLTPADSGPYTGVRSSRGQHTSRKSVQKSVSIPSRGSDAMHSLPNYPVAAPPKDKSAPLVLRRSTDGQLVKLICNNCSRGNFSSIQGFLNHCRIAHKVDYKSHDAAAVDCGRLLEEHELANLSPEAQAQPAAAPKQSVSRPVSTVTTPYNTQNFVHPMNTATATGVSAPQQAKPVSTQKPLPVPSVSQAAPSSHGGRLTPSSQAPRLSAHFAKHKLGGNLEQAISNAKEKVDIGLEDVSSPDPVDASSPVAPESGSRTISGANRAGSLAPTGVVPRPTSRKGQWDSTQRHRPSPLAPVPATGLSVPSQGPGKTIESLSEQSPNLSPHTADSNPGLVSDHEDDDHGSASEDEVPHAPIPHPILGVRRGGGCGERMDSMDLDVAVDDAMDGQHGVLIRRNSMLTADENGLRTASGSSRQLGKDA
ncbi:hypothetical protein KC332_g4336 [Hortaea werneckii]|uniref:AHC1-like C2H2 zinc-finger domain-containing protein n=1 Tax=Hortaea werneckii EXF-2000 TaxID=1157616 RepID=A0A1Z5TGK4_HORWE|nr:hypothetical protein KC350_g5725 [Hortaea werneckii]OTA35051.1 hypothetical protein BTJ68_05174 [Hortaea werneckii EXF-2000]KAI6845350.1 hypothetical protein KC358_g3366 [Hortaea werneckii]KAI6940737.1 hypothetical protein KC341_g3328 [Hortaea werneckii]KAI6949159.1 hypothetical protein KC348_g1514 [Hortaea werneckii]